MMVLMSNYACIYFNLCYNIDESCLALSKAALYMSHVRRNLRFSVKLNKSQRLLNI